ncbi:MAG TPA: GNAT family N-acetyltransferase [Chitinophagaceae bacterium]|jgi:ribosomal protein S18 acetylase RimI-like enzyme|nr:GNAT family N-acetyltransferase [Chitinophagaceae bacterium]
MEEEFIIREAAKEDIHNLAVLHVRAWNETYNNTSPDPSIATREWQWQEQFNSPDKNWFCLVIENKQGELIGFAKGMTFNHPSLPEFDGELNKIYILKAYHKSGLGKKLLSRAFKMFKDMGIQSVVLFGDAKNPAGGFHEAMGAKKLFSPDGGFHGGYGWTNIHQSGLI